MTAPTEPRAACLDYPLDRIDSGVHYTMDPARWHAMCEELDHLRKIAAAATTWRNDITDTLDNQQDPPAADQQLADTLDQLTLDRALTALDRALRTGRPPDPRNTETF